MRASESEIRKSNLVAIHGIVHFVSEILENKIGVRKDAGTPQEIDYYDYEDTEPIPLTEEWLLKLGFELLHKGKFRNVYDLIKDSRFGYSDNYGLANIESAVTFSANDFTHIKYVHQLQNLYFALCGEELELK